MDRTKEMTRQLRRNEKEAGQTQRLYEIPLIVNKTKVMDDTLILKDVPLGSDPAWMK